MPKGRRKSPEGSVTWTLSISADLAERIERELLDPLTMRPRVGARKELIEALMRAWLLQKEKAK